MAEILSEGFPLFFASEAVKEITGTGILFIKALLEPTNESLTFNFS